MHGRALGNYPKIVVVLDGPVAVITPVSEPPWEKKKANVPPSALRATSAAQHRVLLPMYVCVGRIVVTCFHCTRSACGGGHH